MRRPHNRPQFKSSPLPAWWNQPQEVSRNTFLLDTIHHNHQVEQAKIAAEALMRKQEQERMDRVELYGEELVLMMDETDRLAGMVGL